MSFGVLHLAPCLPGFMEAHPHVRVEVSLDDRFVDVVEEGYDLVVRIGAAACLELTIVTPHSQVLLRNGRAPKQKACGRLMLLFLTLTYF